MRSTLQYLIPLLLATLNRLVVVVVLLPILLFVPTCAFDAKKDVTRRAALTALVWAPATPAVASIDVSGLRTEPTANSGNAKLRDQLKAYDGSGSSRVQQIQRTGKEMPVSRTSLSSPSLTESHSMAATYAYRSAPGFSPRLTKIGFGGTQRLEDTVVGSSNNDYLNVSFDFPSDWLQLDKLLGGFQFVDQRNGDKLYLLRAKLPEPLATVDKQFFGQSIFDPKGTIASSGVNVDDYRVKSSEVVSDGTASAPNRRLLIKYATVTGNGLRTERRMLVNAYEYTGVAYMLLTSSNAVKFDAQGRERETVDSIINSFRIE